ncbi:MAG TPA: hypothetical protein VMU15_00340 [Anaeromyxobacter sp.]|nr:hypothetical protein [Anaeromyxobacter sp.]
MSLSRTLGTLLASLTLGLIPGPTSGARAAGGEVTILHRFTGNRGRDSITKVFTTLEQKTGVKVVDHRIGHGDLKAAILVMAAGQELPDVLGFGAGAAFVLESGALQPIGDLCRSANPGSILHASIGNAPRLTGSRWKNSSYPRGVQNKGEELTSSPGYRDRD